MYINLIINPNDVLFWNIAWITLSLYCFHIWIQFFHLVARWKCNSLLRSFFLKQINKKKKPNLGLDIFVSILEYLGPYLHVNNTQRADEAKAILFSRCVLSLKKKEKKKKITKKMTPWDWHWEKQQRSSIQLLLEVHTAHNTHLCIVMCCFWANKRPEDLNYPVSPVESRCRHFNLLTMFG